MLSAAIASKPASHRVSLPSITTLNLNYENSRQNSFASCYCNECELDAPLSPLSDPTESEDEGEPMDVVSYENILLSLSEPALLAPSKAIGVNYRMISTSKSAALSRKIPLRVKASNLEATSVNRASCDLKTLAAVASSVLDAENLKPPAPTPSSTITAISTSAPSTAAKSSVSKKRKRPASDLPPSDRVLRSRKSVVSNSVPSTTEATRLPVAVGPLMKSGVAQFVTQKYVASSPYSMTAVEICESLERNKATLGSMRRPTVWGALRQRRANIL